MVFPLVPVTAATASFFDGSPKNRSARIAETSGRSSVTSATARSGTALAPLASVSTATAPDAIASAMYFRRR